MSLRPTVPVLFSALLTCVVVAGGGTGCGDSKPTSPSAMQKVLRKESPESCKKYTDCHDYRCSAFCMNETDIPEAKEMMEKHCKEFDGAGASEVQVLYGSETETWGRWELVLESCTDWLTKEP